MSTHARWSRVAVVALVLATLAVLVEPIVTIGDPISRNYNEGWNALHTQRLLDGEALYPPHDAFFVNNYPPLSFVVVAGLTRVVGDPVTAGRIVSLVSMVVIALAAAAIARWIAACRGIGILAGAFVLFVFAWHFPHYVVMNDPQMLGHALQWTGLALLMRDQQGRRALWAVAALLIAGGLVKHNLVSVPLGAIACVAWTRRADLVPFLVRLAVLVIAGCAWLVVGWGPEVFSAVLGHARTFDPSRFTAVVKSWFGPLAAFVAVSFMAGPRGDRRVHTLRVVQVLGFGTGLVFALGGGISYNVIFDGAIATCVLAAAGVHALVPSPVGSVRGDLGRALLVVSLGAFTVIFAPASPRDDLARLEQRPERLATFETDRAFVAERPGPVLAGTLALVYAAGKDFDVDLFNVHEAIASGAMDPARLADRIAAREFGVIQLSAYDRANRLGDALMRVIDANYVVARTSDLHGNLYVPRD